MILMYTPPLSTICELQRNITNCRDGYPSGVFVPGNKMVVKGNLPENDTIYYNEIDIAMFYCALFGDYFL